MHIHHVNQCDIFSSLPVFLKVQIFKNGGSKLQVFLQVHHRCFSPLQLLHKTSQPATHPPTQRQPVVTPRQFIQCKWNYAALVVLENMVNVVSIMSPCVGFVGVSLCVCVWDLIAVFSIASGASGFGSSSARISSGPRWSIWSALWSVMPTPAATEVDSTFWDCEPEQFQYNNTILSQMVNLISWT